MFPRWSVAALILATLLLAGMVSARADDGKELVEYKARAGNMSATAISNDGRLIFTGEDDGLVTLWNIAVTGTSVRNFMGHFPRGVFATAILPGDKRGISCGDDNTVRIWDLVTANCLHVMSTGTNTPLVMACSPDGRRAATGFENGRIAIWDTDTGRRIITLDHGASICGMLYSPDGRILAAGYSDGHVVLWDTHRWLPAITLPDADAASVGALAFSSDSKLLATGNQCGGGFVWNTRDGSLFSSFAGYAHPEVTPAPPVAPVFPGSTITPENRGAIEYLCFSRDNSTLFASIQDETARFWDVKSGKFLGTADYFQDFRFYIARFGFTFSTAATTPDRSTIVTTRENAAQVWSFGWTPTPPQ